MEKTGITITKRKDGRYVGKFIAEYADNGKAQYHYVYGKTYEEVERKVRELQNACIGASRAGANGARAKLEYALGCVKGGTTVIIGHARHRLSDLKEGRVPCTRIGVDA